MLRSTSRHGTAQAVQRHAPAHSLHLRRIRVNAQARPSGLEMLLPDNSVRESVQTYYQASTHTGDAPS